MAFEPLKFTKNWENPRDFPTYETDEQQVRADLQLLHDETKAALNRLVEVLGSAQAARELGFAADGLQARNIEAAVLEVYAAVGNMAAGLIPDGTVTAEKLAAYVLERMDAHMEKSGGGFTGKIRAVDGADSSAQLRNTALVLTETDPTVNGQINWTYG
jgi:hypothetical protein